MSLQVWLPFTDGTLKQQGLKNVSATIGGTINLTEAGKLGKCATIGTTAGGITLPASTMTSFTECSVAFWINITAWNTSWDTFFQAGLGSTPWNNYIFGILRNQSDYLCFTISNGSSTSSGGYASSNLTIGQWIHLVFTYSNKKCKIYINGTLDKEYSTSIAPNFADITHISIGRGTSSGYQSKCKLNDFRIYDHCLSLMEVKQISQGLVLHYPLNREGWGQKNLATQYVVPGTNGPLVTTTSNGRTTYYGKYGIIIPATENADTYFSIYLKQALESGKTYTLSCNVSGLLSGSFYNFPLFAQGNSSMGLLKLDHNGLCSLTFTMNYTGTVATSTVNGVTLYRLFMDDTSRTIVSGQGAITITNIKLEEGEKVTPWCPATTDSLYTTMGLDSTVEYDCSGFNNNGTRVGDLTWTSDTPKYNVSTQFANNKRIVVENANTTEVKTIAFWAKTPTAASSNQIAFVDYKSLLAFGFFSNYILVSYGNTCNKVYATTPFTANEWHHVVLVRQNSSTIDCYIDNEIQTVSSGKTDYWSITANVFHIGSRNNSYPWPGLISDFRCYATALSADDIKNLYQNSAYISSNATTYAHEFVET